MIHYDLWQAKLGLTLVMTYVDCHDAYWFKGGSRAVTAAKRSDCKGPWWRRVVPRHSHLGRRQREQSRIRVRVVNIIILLFETILYYCLFLFIFYENLRTWCVIMILRREKKQSKKIMMSGGLHMWTNLLFRMRFIAFAFPIYFCWRCRVHY